MSLRTIHEQAFPLKTLKDLIETHFRALSFIHDAEDVKSIELKINKGMVDLTIQLTNPNVIPKGKVIHHT